jgi:phage gpG-like protein
LLQDSQQSIKDQGPGWLPFKKLPRSPHELEDASGTLLASLALGGSNNIFEQSGDSITVGTSVPYAVFQNDGDSHLPARPFLFIDDTRKDKAARAYSERLMQGVT